MSVFITKDNRLIDKDFFGRRIKYSLWEPHSSIKPAQFAKAVIQAHEKVKLGLPPETRQNITGPKLRPMVERFLELSKDQQQAVILRGFSQPHIKKDVDVATGGEHQGKQVEPLRRSHRILLGCGYDYLLLPKKMYGIQVFTY